MRETSYKKIAIIGARTGDYKSVQDIVEVRGIHANPIIKQENGERIMALLIPYDSEAEYNQIVDLAHMFRSGNDFFVSRRDRSIYRANTTNIRDTQKELGFLKGCQESKARENELYFYDPKSEDYYVCE